MCQSDSRYCDKTHQLKERKEISAASAHGCLTILILKLRQGNYHGQEWRKDVPAARNKTKERWAQGPNISSKGTFSWPNFLMMFCLLCLIAVPALKDQAFKIGLWELFPIQTIVVYTYVVCYWIWFVNIAFIVFLSTQVHEGCEPPVLCCFISSVWSFCCVSTTYRHHDGKSAFLPVFL